ncbi:MAG: hypothetical protein M1303_07550 [Bacteroidetes bacterium]|nr:hypothetical protein [Bacteroidota bacterium]
MSYPVSESPQVGIATSANGEADRREVALKAPLGPMGLRWRSCEKSVVQRAWSKEHRAGMRSSEDRDFEVLSPPALREETSRD